MKDGQPTGEAKNSKDATRLLQALYGMTPVAEFGPMALKAVRQKMIAAKLSRRVINYHVNRIRRVFKWGVENPLVAPQVLHALQAVAALRAGRTEARETGPVRPVPEESVSVILPFVTPQVRAMIELQQLTGMRPNEVTAMRPMDIDRSQATWIYRPARHKTEHHGIERLIYLGPRAQAIIVACPMSAEQHALQDELVKRYERLRKEKVDPREDNALNITTDGRKLATDARLLSAAAADFPGSKVNRLVENVHAIWERTTATRGTQMIFCDMGVHKTSWGYSAYDDVTEKLVRAGIPRSQIRRGRLPGFPSSPLLSSHVACTYLIPRCSKSASRRSSRISRAARFFSSIVSRWAVRSSA